MSVKTIIIYDKTGTILACYGAGYMNPPVGVPFITVDLPDGVSVECVDIKTSSPVYSRNNVITSEVDKINSKMDYIAMQQGMDMSLIADVVLNSNPKDTITVIDGTEETHSINYVRVYNYYMHNLWGLTAVRNAIGKWITNSEFTQIVKSKEEKSSYKDTQNPIPTITV